MRLVNVWWVRPRALMAAPHSRRLPPGATARGPTEEEPPKNGLPDAGQDRRRRRMTTAAVLGLRYLFLTRYSWLLGVVLIAPAPVALVFLPGMLANFFVLDSPPQVFHVSWITLWCAAAVLETLRVTTLNAQHRFDDYRVSVCRFRQAWDRESDGATSEWYKRLDGWLCFACALLTALAIWYVIVDACITRTAADPAPTWAPFLQGNVTAAAVQSAGWRKAFDGLLTTMIILGSVNGMVILGGEWSRRQGSRSSMFFEGFSAAAGARPPARSAPLNKHLHSLARALHYLLGPGYFIPASGTADDKDPSLRLAPGHMGLMLYTAVFLTGYALNYRSATGADPMPTETSPYPALFYGLLSLLLVAYVLPGFAFFLDRYRIPVVLTAVVITLALYGTFGTDHFYELDPAPARGAAGPMPTLTDVLDRWQLPEGRDGRRTLVVVHASGGGIQASAWTAQVLTGLHERYGDEFSRSVGLISAVSGGSVGTMYYLLNRADVRESYDPAGNSRSVLDAPAIAAIRDLSRCSALEATAWGIAYPDAMRAIFPPAVPATRDRGWAIERVWRQRLSDFRPGVDDLGDLRITDLSQRSVRNQFPVAVFNATLVETGQRVIIAPVQGPAATAGTDDDAVELMRMFPGAHPRVSTAARLSATFPYVTPAARAVYAGNPGTDAERIASYHVVDGGYTDNEGAMTSVDWINRLLTHYSRDDTILRRPFDYVLLLRIQAFPKKRNAAPYRRNLLAGWTSALLGPLNAMLNVRGTSQTERGDLEVGLLTQATRAGISASRERFESEFRTAQAWADSVEQEVNALENYLTDLADQGKINQADVARWSSASRDRLTTAHSLVEQVARKRERMEQLNVSAVSFEFRPPQNDWIPFSWKLTARQKRNIDEAWRRLMAQADKEPAIVYLDEYFTPRP